MASVCSPPALLLTIGDDGTAGLRRSGKSCRLRWVNYLRPDLKRGKITPDEETVILQLHAMLGNRYAHALSVCTCPSTPWYTCANHTHTHVHVRIRRTQ